jgi:hypothetical protein
MNTTPCTKSKTQQRIIAVLATSVVICSSIVWLLHRARNTTSTTVVTSPPPTLVVTQYSVGGPLIVASQAPGGPLAVTTQFDVPTIKMQSPARYYIEGRRVSETEFFPQMHRANDAVGLSLIDTHYELPPIDYK